MREAADILQVPEPELYVRYSEQYNKTGAGPVEVWLPLEKK